MNVITLGLKHFKTKKTFYVLCFINIIVSLVIFKISSANAFPDEKGYWIMGKSILDGKFSSWYTLSKYYPETLRTPGYPLFLAFCQLFSNSTIFVKIFQLLFYFASIFLCTLILKINHSTYLLRNLFLLILIPNIQIVFYAGCVSSEILTTFFLVLTTYLFLLKRSLSNAVFIALTCYAMFILRPAFLLFPSIFILYFIIIEKKNFKYYFLFTSTYLVLLIPFGIWNKVNHGIFKITPIEGGGGVAHLGFWQLKLPDGYTEKFYWGNSTSHDYTQPKLYSINEQNQNAKLFEAEWTVLSSELKKYESAEDSVYLDYMRKNNPGIFLLHNSKYTLARESALWKLTRQNIINDPLYYLESRIYHFARVYVTGINIKNLEKSTSLLNKIKNIYPFIVTLIFIFLGMLFITICLLFKKVKFDKSFVYILSMWYCGIIHLLFVIQSRYTIPVHLIVLTILSLTIFQILKSKQAQLLFFAKHEK